jgi:hypothetical protein
MPYTSPGLSKQCSHNFDLFRIDSFIAGGLACLVDLPVRRGVILSRRGEREGLPDLAGVQQSGPSFVTELCLQLLPAYAGQAHSALCDSSMVTQNGDAGEPTEDARKNMPDLAATGA